MRTGNKRLYVILAVAAALLLIPLIAMQFTGQVDWSVFDFLVMGFLLGGTGLLLELVMRKTRKTTLRYVFLSLILLAFLLVWAELGVGIFGTPFAGD